MMDGLTQNLVIQLECGTYHFMSPDNNATFVDFTVYGNAVNGNQASTGDEWNSLDLRLPGTQYEGELSADETDEFNPMDYTVGMVSMIVSSGPFNHHTA